MQSNAKSFSMPKSLEYVKTLGEAGIFWQGLHVKDAFSLVCSLRIDAVRKYLRLKTQEKMQKAGVKSISRAKREDFDAL